MASFGLTKVAAEIRRRRVLGVLALYVVGAWVVLQVANTLFPGWHIPGEAIRFVWFGAVLLFPIAIVFGWYYDLSTQGLRRTPPVDSELSPATLTTRDYGVLSLMAVVTVAICFGVAREILKIQEAPGPEPLVAEVPLNSIAVLPFVNMSDSAENEYFSDGVTEQLLNELARIPELHVAARTSSFYYKGKTESMKTMGTELGVRTLLEGSVRRAGSNVRITAQLINASDGYHLWSDIYDRELDDIFLVQDEIATAIVDTLKIELLAKDQEHLDQSPTDNPEAYDLYLRAMAARQTYSSDTFAESNDYLLRAIELAPDFALAIDALAYGYLIETFYGTRSIDDATDLAAELLETALDLEPNLEEAHATLGLLKSRLRRFDESNDHYETALQINPNYLAAQVNYGLSLVQQSRLKDASANYIRALSVDPLNANLNWNLGALMMLMGQFDDGYELIKKAVSIAPEMQMPKAASTHWLRVYGKLVEAVQNGRKTNGEHPGLAPNIAALAGAYQAIGLVGEARSILSNANETLAGNSQIQNANIDLWLAVGDHDTFNQYAIKAFSALDRNIGDPLSFDERSVVYQYGWSLLIRDENELAPEIFLWAVGGEDGINTITYDDIWLTKPLALSYRRLERDDDADVLLEKCLRLIEGARENGWATPTLFVRLAETHAILGDITNAIKNLDLAYEKGWRDLGTLEYGLYWEGLQDNSELNRIKVQIIEDTEAQRRRLLSESADSDTV